MGWTDTKKFPSKILLWAIPALIFLAMVLPSLRTDFTANHLIDAKVYIAAIHNVHRGISPYLTPPGVLPFVYPPIVAFAGGWFYSLLGAAGWPLYLCLVLVAYLSLPFLIGRYYLGLRDWQLCLAMSVFFLTPFNISIASGLLSGNIATPCYAAALLAAIPGIRSGRWRTFFVVVFFIALIKVTFLLLLLLPLLSREKRWRGSVLCFGATGCAYLLQIALAPNLYRSFQQAVYRWGFAGLNYGFSPFGEAANTLHRFHRYQFLLPWAVEVVFAAAVLLSLVLVRMRLASKYHGGLGLALILVSIVLLNPRMMLYDVTVGILPVYFLMLQGVRSIPRLAMPLLLLSAVGFFIGHGVLGFLFLFTSAFIVGLRCLYGKQRETDQRNLQNIAAASQS